tara:strand:- start:1468 stop:1698 length:231 start_codon:yes stop_codon:yes gene_type:complete
MKEIIGNATLYLGDCLEILPTLERETLTVPLNKNFRDWKFEGSMSSQYKQIGNAVPVNMAFALGRSIVRLLNHIRR